MPEEFDRRRILVVDDEESIQQLLSDVLRIDGHEVTLAHNGREALEQIERQPFDLVISDIKMPDKSGYDVFATARKRPQAPPVILMTGFGYDPHHCIVRASQEGLQSFLFKPFKVSQLMDVVTRSLAKK